MQVPCGKMKLGDYQQNRCSEVGTRLDQLKLLQRNNTLELNSQPDSTIVARRLADSAKVDVEKCLETGKQRSVTGHPLKCTKYYQLSLDGSRSPFVSCTSKKESIDVCRVSVNRGNCAAFAVPESDIGSLMGAMLAQLGPAMTNTGEGVAPVVTLKFGQSAKWVTPLCTEIIEMRMDTNLGEIVLEWEL